MPYMYVLYIGYFHVYLLCKVAHQVQIEWDWLGNYAVYVIYAILEMIFHGIMMLSYHCNCDSIP